MTFGFAATYPEQLLRLRQHHSRKGSGRFAISRLHVSDSGRCLVRRTLHPRPPCRARAPTSPAAHTSRSPTPRSSAAACPCVAPAPPGSAPGAAAAPVPCPRPSSPAASPCPHHTRFRVSHHAWLAAFSYKLRAGRHDGASSSFESLSCRARRGIRGLMPGPRPRYPYARPWMLRRLSMTTRLKLIAECRKLRAMPARNPLATSETPPYTTSVSTR